MTPAVDQRGFSLLEAIVALALMAGVGVALFSWVNASLTSLVRVEEAVERQTASRTALEYLGTINPMQDASGLTQLGSYTVAWQASAVEGPLDGVAHLRRVPSNFLLGLYETRVSIRRQETRIAEFSLKQVGYRRVRGADLSVDGG